MGRLNRLVEELGRRRIPAMAGLYVGCALAAWGGLEVAVDALRLPPGVLTFAVAASLGGLPLALVLTWFLGGIESSRALGRTALLKSRVLYVGIWGIGAAASGTLALLTGQGSRSPASVSGAEEDGGAGESAWVFPAGPSVQRQLTFSGEATGALPSPDGSRFLYREGRSLLVGDVGDRSSEILAPALLTGSGGYTWGPGGEILFIPHPDEERGARLGLEEGVFAEGYPQNYRFEVFALDPFGRSRRFEGAASRAYMRPFVWGQQMLELTETRWFMSIGTVGRFEERDTILEFSPDVRILPPVALSPDGHRVAFTLLNDTTTILSYDRSARQSDTIAHGTRPRSMAWSADSSTLLFVSADHRLYEAAIHSSGVAVRRLMPGIAVRDVAPLPDNSGFLYTRESRQRSLMARPVDGSGESYFVGVRSPDLTDVSAPPADGPLVVQMTSADSTRFAVVTDSGGLRFFARFGGGARIVDRPSNDTIFIAADVAGPDSLKAYHMIELSTGVSRVVEAMALCSHCGVTASEDLLLMDQRQGPPFAIDFDRRRVVDPWPTSPERKVDSSTSGALLPPYLLGGRGPRMGTVLIAYRGFAVRSDLSEDRFGIWDLESDAVDLLGPVASPRFPRPTYRWGGNELYVLEGPSVVRRWGTSELIAVPALVRKFSDGKWEEVARFSHSIQDFSPGSGMVYYLEEESESDIWLAREPGP